MPQPRLAILLTAILCLTAASRAAERSLFDSSNRFLNGSVKMDGAKIKPSTFLIDSFEDADALKQYWTCTAAVEQSSEHATDDGHSLKATFPNKKASLAYHRGGMYWGDEKHEAETRWSSQVIFNDEARLDVFNPENRSVKLNINLGKSFTFDLKPGANTITMKTRDMVDGAYRSTTILPATQISVDDDKPVTLFFDNFHWVGPGLGENLIQFAKCFQCGRNTFGTAHPYFLPLKATTGYTKEQGYGWQKPAAAESSYERSMTSPNSSGRQPHGQLLRESLDDISSPLLVDLPDGKYRIQWTEGIMFPTAGANMPCDYDLSIKANDKIIAIRKGAKDFSERARYFYRRDQTDYLPGEDKWSKYMSDLFYPLECDVEVTGGQLKLEFLTNPINRANASFILIYPIAKAPQIEPEIAALWNDIRSRFNDLEYQQATIDMASKMNLPGLHAEFLHPAEAEKGRQSLAALPASKDGVLVFQRDSIDDVYPDTVPAVESLGNSISTFAPAGEIASLTLNFYATKEIPNLKVEVGAFTNTAGEKIPAAACDLRFVRYEYRMSGQQVHGDWKYMVMPWYLVQRDSITLAKNMAARWWLNVDLPKDAKPGDYTAQAKITAKNLPPKEITLTLNVLPIRLDPVPDSIEYSTRWSLAQQFCSIPDTGYITVSNRMDKAPAAQWATQMRDNLFARAAAEFNLMKRYGINLVYNRIDNTASELRPGGTLTLPEETMKILPMVDLATADKPAHKAFLKREGGYAGALKSTTEAKVQAFAAEGKKALIFGVPPSGFAAWSDVQQEPGIYRFCSGFFMWRIGAAGCVAEPWMMSLSDLYMPFIGHSGQWGSFCVPASNNWPTLNRAVILEGLREGILDYRYVITLERLIKEHADSPDAAAARQYLDTLKNSLKPEAAQYFVNVGNGGWDNTWHQKETAWKAKDYAGARQQIAAFIAKLETAK